MFTCKMFHLMYNFLTIILSSAFDFYLNLILKTNQNGFEITLKYNNSTDRPFQHPSFPRQYSWQVERRRMQFFLGRYQYYVAISEFRTAIFNHELRQNE